MILPWAVYGHHTGDDDPSRYDWWIVRIIDNRVLAEELRDALEAHVAACPDNGSIEVWLERLWTLDPNSPWASRIRRPSYDVAAMQVWDGTEPAFRTTVYGSGV